MKKIEEVGSKKSSLLPYNCIFRKPGVVKGLDNNYQSLGIK